MKVSCSHCNVILIRLRSLDFFQQCLDGAQKLLRKRALEFLARGLGVSRWEEPFSIEQTEVVSDQPAHCKASGGGAGTIEVDIESVIRSRPNRKRHLCSRRNLFRQNAGLAGQ